MRKIFINLFCIAVILFCSGEVKSQYNTGIGPRFGVVSRGFSVIQYFAPRTRGAANIIVSSQYGGFSSTALYEVHSKNHNINIELANVGFYVGVGAHYGYYKATKVYTKYTGNKTSVNAIGFDAIAGIEWKLPHLPLLLSADLKPFIDVNNIKYKQKEYADFALSLRLLF